MSSDALPPAAKEANEATVKAAIAKSQEAPSSSSTSTSKDATTATPTAEPGFVNKDTTVFEDKQNFNVKHPLYSRWQLWWDSASKQDKAKSWDEALVKVIAFDSVEEFWGLYNNVVPPSLIAPNSNYYLFKVCVFPLLLLLSPSSPPPNPPRPTQEGIKPAWEDKANSKGGKWSVQLPRGKYSEQIDSYWLYTMLAAIGETFETPYTDSTSSSSSTTTPPSSTPTPFSDEVTGVIVSARKAFYRINIWTRSSNAQSKERIENIGKHFKYGVLGMKENVSFKENDKVSSDCEFVSHADSQAKYGTKVTKWTV